MIESNLDDERGRAGHYALVPITLTRDGVDLDLRGVALPERLRESPLNLVHCSLSEKAPAPSIMRFEFLDFDAY